MFCPRCHSLLKPKGGISSCSCGYQTKSQEVIKETIEKEDRVDVFTEINPFATYDHVCKKCGFDKAVLIDPQIAVRETWNNSEADHAAYVCGKCGFKEFIN